MSSVDRQHESLVCFAFAATGYGHQSAANAIANSLFNQPNSVPSILIDAFANSTNSVLRNGSAIYNFTSTHCVNAYDAAWNATNRPLLNRATALLSQAPWARSELDEISLDLVVVTHPLLVPNMARTAIRRSDRSAPLVTVVTDPVSPHLSWTAGEPDYVFAVTDIAADRLEPALSPNTTLMRVQFPVSPEFQKPRINPAAGRHRAGLRDLPTALFVGGGAGSGQIDRDVRLALSTTDHQLLVACGENRKLLAKFSNLDERVIALGPRSSLLSLYDAADWVVGKAGPATIHECQARGRPLLATSEVGFQERGNIAFSISLGVGTDCRSAANLVEALRSNPVQTQTAETTPPRIETLLVDILAGREVGCLRPESVAAAA